jgi:hypothetical protein
VLDLGFLLLDRATNVFPHHACSAFSEGTRYEGSTAGLLRGIRLLFQAFMGELQAGSYLLYFVGRCMQDRLRKRDQGPCRLDCIWTKQSTTWNLEACEEGQAPGGRSSAKRRGSRSEMRSKGGRLALGRYLACGVLPAERICGALTVCSTVCM